ncbi:MAG: Flp pilus assembly protein RcpC/CpaB [Chloroflexi bacterium]|nr:Flp pilus assembly protein RcpC/CpaB [Chloroflexota bacterium]
MQMMRSSRGLLVIGGVLAVAAFVLVVVLLNNKSTPTAVILPTPTVGTPLPTAIPTVGLGVVVAVRDIPAQTKFTNLTSVYANFKDVSLGTGSAQPANAVNSINDWVTTDTRILSNTSFLGTILITQPIRRNSPLLTTNYKVLPISPLLSLANQINPGRVAMSVQLTGTQADNLQVLPGDFVDLLLTIRQRETDSLLSSPADASSLAAHGPLETQQLISNARVVAVGLPVAPGSPQMFTLELPLQDALLLKYVKDSTGTIDMVLISAGDVKNQTVQPKTHAIFPEYFTTPQAIVKGTPQGNGLPNVFVTPIPTPTSKPSH